jgi:hypothetical protein
MPRVGVSYSPLLPPDADTLWQKARLGMCIQVGLLPRDGSSRADLIDVEDAE